jgi:hypothetical protein
MLFIHPMWDNESQRIGMQKCTPFGYALRVAADLIGIVGLLVLLVVPVLWLVLAIVGAFQTWHFWLIGVPFSIGLVSELLFQCSWKLALRRGFQYDFDERQASWLEAGERHTFKWKP